MASPGVLTAMLLVTLLADDQSSGGTRRCCARSFVDWGRGCRLLCRAVPVYLSDLGMMGLLVCGRRRAFCPVSRPCSYEMHNACRPERQHTHTTLPAKHSSLHVSMSSCCVVSVQGGDAPSRPYFLAASLVRQHNTPDHLDCTGHVDIPASHLIFRSWQRTHAVLFRLRFLLNDAGSTWMWLLSNRLMGRPPRMLDHAQEAAQTAICMRVPGTHLLRSGSSSVPAMCECVGSMSVEQAVQPAVQR